MKTFYKFVIKHVFGCNDLSLLRTQRCFNVYTTSMTKGTGEGCMFKYVLVCVLGFFFSPTFFCCYTINNRKEWTTLRREHITYNQHTEAVTETIVENICSFLSGASFLDLSRRLFVFTQQIL